MELALNKGLSIITCSWGRNLLKLKQAQLFKKCYYAAFKNP